MFLRLNYSIRLPPFLLILSCNCSFLRFFLIFFSASSSTPSCSSSSSSSSSFLLSPPRLHLFFIFFRMLFLTFFFPLFLFLFIFFFSFLSSFCLFSPLPLPVSCHPPFPFFLFFLLSPFQTRKFYHNFHLQNKWQRFLLLAVRT